MPSVVLGAENVLMTQTDTVLAKSLEVDPQVK